MVIRAFVGAKKYYEEMVPFIHSPFQGHSLVAESQILSPDGDLLEERLIKHCSIY